MSRNFIFTETPDYLDITVDDGELTAFYRLVFEDDEAHLYFLVDGDWLLDEGFREHPEDAIPNLLMNIGFPGY